MTAPQPPSLTQHAADAARGLPTAVALSMSAGFLDAFTFLGHGQSFASVMTGNLVLLGIGLARLSFEALDSLYALLAFMSGVALTNVLTRPWIRRRLPFSISITTLVLEVVVLGVIATRPAGFNDHLIVIAVTVSAAMQNTSFRTIGKQTYNSVIMTGNLQSFSTALLNGVSGDGAAWDKAREFGAVLAGFLGGALAGGLATPRFGNAATILPAVLLAGVAASIATAHRDASGRP